MLVIKKIYHFIIDNKVTTLAGGLSFFVLFNGGSFLFLNIVLDDLFAYSFIEILINQLNDNKLKDFLLYFFTYQDNLSYSVILIISSIYSSSSLYYHLIHISEIITDFKYLDSFPKRLFSILLTVVFILLLNVIMVLSSYLMIIFKSIYKLILYITIFIVSSFVIIVSNMVSLKTLSFKKIYRGLIFTIIYFVIFTIGFIKYITIFSNFKIVYGVLSFLLIFLFYVYILSIGLIVGICINCQNIDVLSLVRKK